MKKNTVSNIRNHIKIISTISFVALSINSALAQGTAEVAKVDEIIYQIERIQVTARKRSEVLTEVPETITAFSSDTLKKAGIKNIDDLGKVIPNVILNRRGDNEPNVVIRGIGAFGNVQGVGFYVDDVQNFFDQSARIVDLQRIEVLKGPQGTLYGGSAIGGAIKYVTQKPTENFEAKISTEIGNLGTKNINGSVNFALSESVFARVSAYRDSSDGFSMNSVTGINNDKSKETGVKAAIRFWATDVTDINASIRWSDLENGGNDYYVTNNVADYRYASPLNEDIFNKRQVFGGILNISHDFGENTRYNFTSVSSFTQRDNEILWDLDYGPANGVIASHRKPVKSDAYTQELRISTDGVDDFNWLIGLYAADTSNRLLVIEADVTIGADYNDGTDLVIEDFNNSTSSDKNFAAFVNMTYEYEGFEIGTGVRLNYNNFTGTNYNLNETNSYKDTVLLPKLTLSYDIDDNTLLYGIISRGYEPGKVNVVSDTLDSYTEETTTNFEIGLKGTSDDQSLSYELAGFVINNYDRQYETQILDENQTPVDLTTNVGDSTSVGLEAAISYQANKELTLSFSGGWLDAQYDTATFLLENYDGNKVPYAPKSSASASIDYDLEISNSLLLNFRADAQHVGEFFWDIPNLGKQEAYQTVGLRIALT
ncbi:MAG: TonB-dependent receptor, partial [Paraglaciecola sp.]|nr:TonB-dependent receptor [Paraglaciecola sp.]